MEHIRPTLLSLGAIPVAMMLTSTTSTAQAQEVNFASELQELFCPDGPIRTVGFRSNGPGQTPDLVVASGTATGKVHVLRDLVTGNYAQTTSITVGSYGENTLGEHTVSLAHGDLNDDGQEDVVFYWNRWNNYIPQQLFGLISSGPDLVHQVLGEAIQPDLDYQFRQRVELFDVNGDGRMDLLLPGTSVTLSNPSIAWSNNLLLGQQSDGSFVPTSAQLTPSAYMQHRDINSDGLDDIFMPHDAGQSITYLNQGGGAFVPVDTNGIRPPNDSWLDFDQDGIADVVVGWGTSDSIRVTGYPVMNASIGFGQTLFSVAEPGNAFWKAARAADLNADGHLDILVKTGSHLANSQLYRVAAGNGTWPINSLTQTLVQCDQQHFLLEDVDADGDIDLIVHDNDCVQWLENLQFTAVNIHEVPPANISLYPVPAAEHLVIRNDHGTGMSGRVEIQDMQGRLVSVLVLQPGNVVLPVGHLAPGAYLVRVMEGTDRVFGTARILIAR